MCGPEGLYPVCYVRCDSDCGDVAPAKGRGRCQSKNACEEHRQNATGNGIVARLPASETAEDNNTPTVDLRTTVDSSDTSNKNDETDSSTNGMIKVSYCVYLVQVIIYL